MVRFQIMTYSTKTGHAIKSAFELFSWIFLAISLIFPDFSFYFLNFPSFPVIKLHPQCKLTACVLTHELQRQVCLEKWGGDSLIH